MSLFDDLQRDWETYPVKGQTPREAELIRMAFFGGALAQAVNVSNEASATAKNIYAIVMGGSKPENLK